MAAPNERGSALRPALGAGLFATVLAADLAAGPRVATGVVYAAAVLFLRRERPPFGLWSAACVASLLVLLGLYLGEVEAPFAELFANRGLALLAIWTTAIACRCERTAVLEADRRAAGTAELGRRLERAEVARRDLLQGQEGRSRALMSIVEDLELERGYVALEIAERSKVEESLRRSEERARSIFERALDAIVTVDDHGRVTGWNLEAERTFGWPAGEALGGLMEEMIIPPALRAQHRAGFERFVATRKGAFANNRLEFDALRRSGEQFPIEIAIVPVELTGGFEYSAFIRDISVRRRLEAAETELSNELKEVIERLKASNEDLQQFAYIASHDLQTPLRAISGFAQIMAEDYHDRLDAEAHDHLDRIVRAVGRMRALIDDLLSYSRVESQAAAFEELDLGSAVDEALAILGGVIDEAAADVSRDALPEIRGDRVQLVQLFQNLIGNALKYRGTGPPAVHVSAAPEDGGWTISVRDNGIGIEPRHHEQIFEIFRRLHGHDRFPGTGIGLAICRRVANRHGGRIWVESEIGRGSTFHCFLPESQRDQALRSHA
jgi:PAS domain S-box-containing protein